MNQIFIQIHTRGIIYLLYENGEYLENVKHLQTSGSQDPFQINFHQSKLHASNAKQQFTHVTHQSINQANNPFLQYTNQFIMQPIRYGYPEADDAYRKALAFTLN